MVFYYLASLAGVPAGWLLFRNARTLPGAIANGKSHNVSLIIPARNEEATLPTLLRSLREGTVQPAEIIVVDDHSSDRTAEIARGFGAKVIAAAPLPPGWTGKTWACAQGARAAAGTTLLFLDADTMLAPDGLARILNTYWALQPPSALSVLPFHAMQRAYEQLSLFFNLIMAAGAGGFSGFVEPELFGQSLMIDRDLYQAVGGHESVRQHVLENLHMAAHIREAGRKTITAVGQGSLSMCMFPGGTSQLVEGWTKGFAAGAASTPRSTVWLISLWIAGLALSAINLLAATVSVPTSIASRCIALLVYVVFATQIFVLSHRFGSFKFWAALVYPVFLAFYLAVFARSVLLRRRGTGATWKGRSL
ncbi:4,4'-diaponeurosporenoate glycosyltransferase [Bryocella elongata]|uniref:4,4'-diaponeurosporenoate glycosyltransferase n=1 Tax=Bryocella elongata TaxID=863522 RepID=A0A1H5VYT9_9BACT|nr:glycosyltransferase [Bryocella elongata]SEF92442.1 4,4'-diaponeurosporenoate glycosyltransferase [Bryocella elongata]